MNNTCFLLKWGVRLTDIGIKSTDDDNHAVKEMLKEILTKNDKIRAYKQIKGYGNRLRKPHWSKVIITEELKRAIREFNSNK